MSEKNQRIEVVEEVVRPYGMYFIDYLSLPDRELKVLLALKSFAWYQKSDCYPSLESLGERANKKRSQVTEILGVLEKKGLIRIDRTPGQVNKYFITNAVVDENAVNPEIRIPMQSGNPDRLPVRKSGLPPSGNPDYPRPEIRTLNNIKKYKKEREREDPPSKSSFSSSKSKKPKAISQRFKPSDAQVKYANDNNLNIDDEKKKFISYFQGTGDLRVKWRPSFTTWLQRSVGYKSNKNEKHLQKNDQISALNRKPCIGDPDHPGYEQWLADRKRVEEREVLQAAKRQEKVNEVLARRGNLMKYIPGASYAT